MKSITNKVLQENSYFAHPENIIIACLADSRVQIREKAVTYILTARDMFDQEIHPKKFLPPHLNIEATDYVDMIDWDIEQKTEPPLTMKLSREEIISARKQPLILPKYPCQTQNVERTVPVVTDSCLQKVGYSARHRWILSTLESRRLVPKFNTEKKYVVI